MSGIAVSVAVVVGVSLGWWGALAVAMAALVAALIDTQRSSLLLAGVIVLSAGLGAWRAANKMDLPAIGGGVAVSEVTTVVTDPVRNGRYQQFIVEGGPSVAIGTTAERAQMRVCVTAHAAPIVRIGDSLALRGTGVAASDGSVGQRAYLAMRDCSHSFFATSVSIVGMTASPQRALADLRSRIEGVLRRAAPGDAGVLLSGLVTGDDEGFSTAREQAFANSATTHLTAVSGSNLALVAGICAALGAATVGRHRIAWQAASITAIWSYALLSGFQAPAIRAAIVTTGAIFAFRVGRRPDFVTLIALAAGAMVLVEPRQIEGLGFRLSVAASLALAIVLPAMIERGRAAAAAGIVLATAAAQLATLPLLLPIFGTVSIYALPANVIVAPLVAVAMPIAFCGAFVGLASPELGEVIVAPAVLAAKATLGIVDVFGAPSTALRFGIPPMDVALVIGTTSAVLLLVLAAQLAGTRAPRTTSRRTWRRPATGDAHWSARGGMHSTPPATTSSPAGEGD